MNSKPEPEKPESLFRLRLPSWFSGMLIGILVLLALLLNAIPLLANFFQNKCLRDFWLSLHSLVGGFFLMVPAVLFLGFGLSASDRSNRRLCLVAAACCLLLAALVCCRHWFAAEG